MAPFWPIATGVTAGASRCILEPSQLTTGKHHCTDGNTCACVQRVVVCYVGGIIVVCSPEFSLNRMARLTVAEKKAVVKLLQNSPAFSYGYRSHP